MKPRFALYGRLLLLTLVLGWAGLAAGCLGRINVVGRDVPDREYRSGYDTLIAREKQGLPTDQRDVNGGIQSWDKFWCTIGPAIPTAQSRRLKRYIIERRRALGLRELTCGSD